MKKGVHFIDEVRRYTEKDFRDDMARMSIRNLYDKKKSKQIEAHDPNVQETMASPMGLNFTRKTSTSFYKEALRSQ